MKISTQTKTQTLQWERPCPYASPSRECCLQQKGNINPKHSEKSLHPPSPSVLWATKHNYKVRHRYHGGYSIFDYSEKIILHIVMTYFQGKVEYIPASHTIIFFFFDKFSLLLLFIVGPWRGDKSSFLEYGLAIWGKFDFPWWCWPSSPSTLRTLVTGACGDDVDHHHLYLRHHHQVRVVVMLTNLVEGCGFPSLKCALYWPDKVPPSSYSFGRMVLLQIIIFYKWCQ